MIFPPDLPEILSRIPMRMLFLCPYVLLCASMCFPYVLYTF